MVIQLWASQPGEALYDALRVDEGIDDLIPRTPAVYMWKRTLRPDIVARSDPSAFIEWIDKLCSSPYGQIIDTQLNHFLAVQSIELSGRGLSKDKRGYLRTFLSDERARRWMTEFLAGLDNHLPSLYVGETGNLVTRVAEHIEGQSSFGQIINTSTQLDWRDLTLHYCIVRATDELASKVARQTLEYLTSTVTVAGFSQRIG
ncbi:hypothetical protein [Gordonia sp. IITR100]|uniref:hypothetical protein n=1 Tax=Gordonia sp. IITR100 TaxID=1314686 RepID=UPI0011174F08|nr:hypothetical protein [Gordonia sp. IITR100]